MFFISSHTIAASSHVHLPTSSWITNPIVTLGNEEVFYCPVLQNGHDTSTKVERIFDQSQWIKARLLWGQPFLFVFLSTGNSLTQRFEGKATSYWPRRQPDFHNQKGKTHTRIKCKHNSEMSLIFLIFCKHTAFTLCPQNM